LPKVDYLEAQGRASKVLSRQSIALTARPTTCSRPHRFLPTVFNFYYPTTQRSTVVSVSVCASVGPRAYIKKLSIASIKTARQIFTKFSTFVTSGHGAVSSGGVAICCVLPVLWMTTNLQFNGHEQATRNTTVGLHIQSDSQGSRADLTSWRMLKMTHQRAAPA